MQSIDLSGSFNSNHIFYPKEFDISSINPVETLSPTPASPIYNSSSEITEINYANSFFYDFYDLIIFFENQQIMHLVSRADIALDSSLESESSQYVAFWSLSNYNLIRKLFLEDSVIKLSDSRYLKVDTTAQKLILDSNPALYSPEVDSDIFTNFNRLFSKTDSILSLLGSGDSNNIEFMLSNLSSKLDTLALALESKSFSVTTDNLSIPEINRVSLNGNGSLYRDGDTVGVTDFGDGWVVEWSNFCYFGEKFSLVIYGLKHRDDNRTIIVPNKFIYSIN